MQMQQKKIKGFTLLELMVVIIIIGLISAIGFLPFQSWRSDRLARAGAVSVSSVIQDIYSQVQRGHYSFSMFRVCLLYTSPSPRDGLLSRMPSSA